MYGVAFEGGGARGAYHVGAMKAINECGFATKGFVGTSIGSFNSAVIAQGDFDKLYDLWWNASSTLILDIDEKELKKAVNKKIDIDSIKYWSTFVASGITNKGLDTTKLRAAYSSYIDEDKLRSSDSDYGLVTFSISDRKPVYITKENIADGKVVDYVLASSNLPVFKQGKLVDGKSYIDGGFYDNCPMQILIDKGYTDIIEVRTETIGIIRNVDRKNLNIYTITPSKELGSILFSDNNLIRQNILMGYFDAIRVFKGYLGKEYYVIPTTEDDIFLKLSKISDAKLLQIIDGVKIGQKMDVEPRKMLFEDILPYIGEKIKDKDTSSYQKLLIAILEVLGTEMKLPIYKLYEFEELLKIVKSKALYRLKKEEKQILKNYHKILMLRLILAI